MYISIWSRYKILELENVGSCESLEQRYKEHSAFEVGLSSWSCHAKLIRHEPPWWKPEDVVLRKKKSHFIRSTCTCLSVSFDFKKAEQTLPNKATPPSLLYTSRVLHDENAAELAYTQHFQVWLYRWLRFIVLSQWDKISKRHKELPLPVRCLNRTVL